MHKHRFQNPARCFFLAVLITLASNSLHADEAASNLENELLGVLRSDAPGAEKAIACKKLAIHGSAKSVPELTKLLPNPQLSSWARIALEAIPGDASDEALRNAAGSLEGRLLIGMINSIGVRRDAKAVELLTTKLKDKDVEVASAAAVALGHIGNATATKSLRVALETTSGKLQSAVAEGCVLCAERLHNAGEATVAVAIYDEVRKSDVPLQRVIEATRGAILARGQDGITLLMETMQSDNKKLFQLALGTVREFPGGDVDKALATEVAKATPARAALIVQAMADRPDTVVLSAVLKAAEGGDKQVRLSAIDALKRVGNESCLTALLELAVDDDEDLARTARETLTELPGKGVNDKIRGQLPTAAGATYGLLLQLIGERRIDAVDDVLKALESDDQDVRAAAFAALGETVSLKRLSILIDQAIAPKHADDAAAAQQALRVASVRMPDREACATELTAALDRAPASTKSMLLEVLSDVGGETALQTLAEAAKSDDDSLQDTSSRLLGKWNSVAAAPVLLDLAKTGPAEKYRIRALRGYIGLARKFAMPPKQRVAMCQNAFDSTKRLAEKKLVLDVLKLHPSPGGLRLAIDAIKVPELKTHATATAMAIAQKVGGKGANVSKLLAGAGLDKVKLEIVKAEYGAGTNRKDVTATLQKRAADSPLITLASATYNTSFGGDPAPGVAKQLKVEYRINGKTATASFAENDLILLPMPK